MTNISQTIFSDAFFVNQKFCILIQISPKFVSRGPINNIPSSVQIMACRLCRRKAIIWTNEGKFTDRMSWTEWPFVSNYFVEMFVKKCKLSWEL